MTKVIASETLTVEKVRETFNIEDVIPDRCITLKIFDGDEHIKSFISVNFGEDTKSPTSNKAKVFVDQPEIVVQPSSCTDLLEISEEVDLDGKTFFNVTPIIGSCKVSSNDLHPPYKTYDTEIGLLRYKLPLIDETSLLGQCLAKKMPFKAGSAKTELLRLILSSFTSRGVL